MKAWLVRTTRTSWPPAELRRPFIVETVFCHPSKLGLIDAARAAGYTVALHAVIVPEDVAVQRVRHRVAAGGHDVPETKIRERHRRLRDLVADAISLSDIAAVYDNSARRGPRCRPDERGRDHRCARLAGVGTPRAGQRLVRNCNPGRYS